MRRYRLLRELLLLLLLLLMLEALLIRPHLLHVPLYRARPAMLPHERLALAQQRQFARPARPQTSATDV
jgi:hypothetical protein